MMRDRFFIAILLLGAAVRLAGLGERSLSYDECQQYWAAQGDVLRSNREITLDPPGFAWLLHLHAGVGRAASLLGSDASPAGEAWLRLLPCVMGILAIAVVHRMALSATGNAWPARAAALFFALAPYPIRYSQSLRVYSQAMLCAAALVAVYLVATNEEGARGWRRPVLLALLTFAALLSVYGSVWLVLMLALVAARRFWRERGRATGRALVGLVSGGALALPWYLLSIPVQMSAGTPAHFYDDKFLPLAPWPAVRFLAIGTLDLFSFLSYIHPATGLLFGGLAVLGAVLLRRTRRGADVTTLFLGCLVLAAAASAFRLYPYGGTRQMLFAAPLFYVLAASGIEALRRRFGGLPAAAALLAMAAGAGLFLYRYHTGPGRQEMRPVIRSLQAAVLPGDRILVNKDALPQFRYYYRGDRSGVVEGRETVIGDYVAEVNRTMAAAPESRWWLVFSHGWSAERRGELEGVDPQFLSTQQFEAAQAGAYLFVPRAGAAAIPGAATRPGAAASHGGAAIPAAGEIP
jgi:hypothetical protein